MTEIVPAILTDKPETYRSQLENFAKFAKRIQIDFLDGNFTSQATVPLSAMAPLPEGVNIDLHMMVVRPSQYLPEVLKLKPALCILHAECGEDLLPIFHQLKKAGIRAGLALMAPTYPGDVKAYVNAADHVLIFAGELGKQGGTADLLQIEKSKILQAIKPQGLEIGWDGGANLENIRMIAHANIGVINVGSAIAGAKDPAAAYKALFDEADHKGVRI